MMKLSPRIVFLMLTCAMLSGCLNGAKLKCQFTSGRVTGFLPELSYYCRVVDNSMYDGSRVTIDGIEGNHLNAKTNNNVDQIYFDSISKLNYLPQNIQSFFKNLISIRVYHSNLQEISQEDLRPFPKLKEFYLYGTKIKTLDEDLFKYNPELKVIYLSSNQISHIDANVFDGLNYLEILLLSGNQCKSQLSDVYTRSEVLKSIQRIKNGDCADPNIIQQKEAARIQAIENIKIQQAANEECSTKNAEMKINLASLTNEKSTLAKDLNDLRVQHEKLESKYDETEKSIEQLRSEHLLCKKSKNDSISELHKIKRKYEEAKRINDEKLKSVEQSNSDLNVKILSIEKSKNDEIIELMRELNVLWVQHESLLKSKLEQSEKLVDKLVEKIPVASDDKTQSEDVEKKVSGDGNCLTLFFGPEQRPIILAN